MPRRETLYPYSLEELAWLSSDKEAVRLFSHGELAYSANTIADASGVPPATLYSHVTRKKFDPKDLASVVYYLAEWGEDAVKRAIAESMAFGREEDRRYNANDLRDVALYLAAWGEYNVRKHIGHRLSGSVANASKIELPRSPRPRVSKTK